MLSEKDTQKCDMYNTLINIVYSLVYETKMKYKEILL